MWYQQDRYVQDDVGGIAWHRVEMYVFWCGIHGDRRQEKYVVSARHVCGIVWHWVEMYALSCTRKMYSVSRPPISPAAIGIPIQNEIPVHKTACGVSRVAIIQDSVL